MRKLLVASAAALAMALTSATDASAATVRFSNSLNDGGNLTINNLGGVGDIRIENAIIEIVKNIDTNVSALVTAPGTGCGPGGNFGCLNITSGAFVGPGSGTHEWVYSGVGSSLTITGSAGGGGPVLYSGSFDSLVGDDISVHFDTNAGGQFTGTGTIAGTLKDGALDPVLAAFLGVTPVPDGGTSTNNFFSFKFTAKGEPNGSGTITTNTVQLVVPSVPEPASLMLFGVGLAAAARVSMRRRRG